MFRPGSAIPWVAVSGALVLFLLGDAVIRSGLGEALLLAPWPLLALWGVYVASFCSHVRAEPDAVTVQNMLRVTRVPWSRVRELEWRWQVIFHLDDDTLLRAVGGPTQGRQGRRPGDPSKTPAGVVAQFDAIRQLWEHGRIGDGEAEPIRRGWDVPSVLALAVLVVWAVVAVLVTGGPG